MKVVTVYELAFFTLPGDGYVLAALAGEGTRKVRGAMNRRWRSLAFGDRSEVLKHACKLACMLEEGQMIYHPKRAMAAEGLIELIRHKLATAVPTGHRYPSPNKPRIKGFCIRVLRDAMTTWKAQDPVRAGLFLAKGPVERQPYEHLVLEKGL